jgi:hypothetical protein
MTDYTEDWRRITARWKRGRRAGLFHLLVIPLLVCLLSFPVKWFAPDGWMMGGEPVGYFIVCAALWFGIFIWLLWRDRYYECPRCRARVRPFGGTDIPDWNPHPCPRCGLRAPAPPY